MKQKGPVAATLAQPGSTRHRRSVVILGAGADVPFKLPTVPDLVRDLAGFCRTDGKKVDRALRKKVPHVRLNFERVGGDMGDALVSRLFDHPEDVVPSLASIRKRLTGDSASGPVGEVIDSLCKMAESNRVDAKLVERLANATGDSAYGGSSENVLDPSRLALTPLVRNAIRQSFDQVLVSTGDLTSKERGFLEEIVLATSSIEDLLASQFARFSYGGLPERRTYLYLAWILWAFLRIRSTSAQIPSKSIYDSLRDVRPPVVTFNYTNFFGKPLDRSVLYFHGRLDRFLRFDDRQVITNSRSLRQAVDSDSVIEFFDHVRLDVAQGSGLDLPAIVPPITFKPLMSRDQLLVWAETDALLQKANRILIVGYSFAQADEHFQSLLRSSSAAARIVVVNPDLEGIAQRAGRVLGIERSDLQRAADHGRQILRHDRLTCIEAYGEDITAEDLDRLLD